MVMIAAGENVDPGKRNIVAQETQKLEHIPEPLPYEEELQFSPEAHMQRRDQNTSVRYQPP